MKTSPKKSGKEKYTLHPESVKGGKPSRFFRIVALQCALLMLLLAGALAVFAAGENVEWDSINGGGGKSTDPGSNILNGTVSQLVVKKAANSNEWWHGYRVGIPNPPNVTCANGGACSGAVCYGPTNKTFTFTSGTSFHVGATQYYRYLWQMDNTYTTIDSAGEDWSTSNILCGGTCTKATNPMTLDATGTSDTWYLLVRSYNGGQADADGLKAPTTDGTGVQILGPYMVDITGPGVDPGNNLLLSNVESSDQNFLDELFDMNWGGGTIADPGCAGGTLACKYCVKTGGACGDADFVAAGDDASDGTCSKTSIPCTGGVTYNLNMRVYDSNNNYIAAESSDLSRTCDDSTPVTTDDKDNSWQAADVSVTLSPSDTYSGIKDTYYCVDTANSCSPGTSYSTPVDVTCAINTACVQYIRYYSEDNVDHVETTSSQQIRIDKQKPTTTDNWTDVWTATDQTITLTPSDCGNPTVDCSGLLNTKYCVDTDNTCAPAGGSTGTSVDVTCAANSVCVQYVRYASTDNVNNVEDTNSKRVRIDKQAPALSSGVLPATNLLEIVTNIVSGDTTCGDGSGSGLHSSGAYDIQYCDDGTTVSANGQSCDGSWTSGTPGPSGYSTTQTESFTGLQGHYYWMRALCRDNVLNVGTYYSPGYVFISSGGYIVVTENENPDNSVDGYYDSPGAPSKPMDLDGVLNPNGTAYEEIQITLYDENDTLLVLDKTVTVTLGNVGSTGAYISATDIDSPAPTPGAGVTSITGTLTGGQGYIRVTATAAATGAVSITASADQLSGQGGRTQKAYILVRTPTGGTSNSSNIGIEGVATGTEDILTDSTVFNPVWSHSGKYMVFAARKSGQVRWNLYAYEYDGGAWVAFDADVGGDGRLTGFDMCVQPTSGFSFTGDDNYIVFSGKDPCQASGLGITVDMYAVVSPTNVPLPEKTNDKDKTLLQLAGEGKMISNGANDSSYRRWYDASWGEWGADDCAGSSYADMMLVTLMKKPPDSGDLELYLVSGTKNAIGLYTEFDEEDPPNPRSSITQLTDLNAKASWAMMGAFSNDCNKIVFTVYTGPNRNPSGNPQLEPYTGIYMMDLDQAWSSLPITSLPAQGQTVNGVTAIQVCDYGDGSSPICDYGAGLYPRFSADNTMVSYMVDKNQAFDMYELIVQGASGDGDLAQYFLNSNVNFDNYLEYILDQPLFAPQLIGESANNEFGLVQCAGGACPLSSGGGKIFSYVTQKYGERDGVLKFLELDNMSTITANGGLLFYQGAVTAVIPPGAVVQNEVKLQVTSPSGVPVGGSDGKDLLVSVGSGATARDFFPDGIVFDSDIRMIFQYCDSNNNGILDADQSYPCGDDTSDGVPSIDENKLFVYFYCEPGSTVGCTAGQWNQLDGTIDPVNNRVTISINHFSEYDVLALMRGRLAPAAFVPLNLNGLVTFPNPWRRAAGAANPVYFFADDTSTANPNIQVSIQIYDIRGQLVRTISDSYTNLQADTTSVRGGFRIATWDVRNNSGREVASGVYPYVLKIFDGVFAKTYKGKLAVVR